MATIKFYKKLLPSLLAVFNHSELFCTFRESQNAMNLPRRLESALLKLYEAYTKDHLHPEDACRCAVGNILNEKDFWKHLSDDHGSLKLNPLGRLHEYLGRTFEGYRPSELLKVEAAFLMGCGYSLPLHHMGTKPTNPTHPDTLFSGLSSAIETLCALEGIYNVLELSLKFDSVRVEKKKKQHVHSFGLSKP